MTRAALSGPLRLFFWVFCLTVIAALGPAAGQSLPSKSQPVVVTADEVDYDRERGLVVAKGNVEISQGARILRANSVVYNQKTKTVIAHGKVSLTEPTGQVVFAERIELKEDLRAGVVQNFRMLFPDETRIAANSAVRTKGRRTEMNKVVFSPCRLCPENPKRPPLWQLKARKVVHDQVTRDITYYDAWMEVFGAPILYTPYLRHPDPTVKRRSGFLAPIYGSNSQLGFFFGAPYFQTVGPSADLTLTPVIYTKVRPAIFGTWRHRVKNGLYDIRGSYTNVKRRDSSNNEVGGNQNRGHIFTTGRFDVDKTWRLGWDGGWTSDQTYLRRYRITSDRAIETTAWLEGFRGRNYASVRGFYFQGLRQDDVQNEKPIVLPFIDYNLVSGPLGSNGEWGRWALDFNTMILTRVEGTDSRRFSLKGKWEMPKVTSGGHLFNFGATLQADLYHVNKVIDTNNPGTTINGPTGRVFPTVYADWRYPVVRELGNVRHVIEPRVQLVLAPTYGNPRSIPNEDSRDFDLDDVNIFDISRFNGLDRVELGPRVTYGVSSAFYGNRGGRTEIFLGNSYRFTTNSNFPSNSGLNENFSDLVGRVTFQPASYAQIIYRFGLKTDNFRARRHEISAAAGPPALRGSLGYFFFRESGADAEFGDREEVFGTLLARITKQWSVNATGRYDLSDPGGPVKWGIGASFVNECCTVQFNFSRDFTTDRDVKVGNTFVLRIVLKHLGEVSASR